MINEFWYEKIEDFLLNKLTTEEMAAMEKAIESDNILANELALRKLEFLASEELIAKDIRSFYKSISVQPTESTLISKNFYNKWLWGILTVLVITIVALLTVKNKTTPAINSKTSKPDSTTNQKDSNDSLEKSMSTPSDSILIKHQEKLKRISNIEKKSKLIALANTLYHVPEYGFTRNNSSNDDPLSIALDNWNEKNWNQVILQTKNVPKSSPQYIKAIWMQAHSQFLLHNYIESGKLFEQIRKSGIMPYTEEAEWYSLLNMVATFKQDTELFKTITNKIVSDSDHPFYEDALRLKNEMRK